MRNDLWDNVREGERKAVEGVRQDEKMKARKFVVKGNGRKHSRRVRVRKS